MVPIGRSNIPEMTYGLKLSANWKVLILMPFSKVLHCLIFICGSYPGAGWVDDTFYTKTILCRWQCPVLFGRRCGLLKIVMLNIPRLSTEARLNGGKYSDWWLKNGTYIRLKKCSNWLYFTCCN